MIVSHQHRFIFLKTLKTAGTSIEIALSKHCGARDTITRMVRTDDEDLRKRLGYRGHQNDVLNGRIFSPHAAAWAAKKYFPEPWEKYFKFAVVRNPWELCASAYAMRAAHGLERGRTFSDYVASDGFPSWTARWREVFMIEGRVAVDEIVRYEDLAGGLEKVRLRIGLPEPLDLPHAKSGFRAGHYRDVVSPSDAEVIARLFAPEIEAFGYRY